MRPMNIPQQPEYLKKTRGSEVKPAEEEKATLKFAVKVIQFETNLAKLKTDSYPILNDILLILKKYPDYQLHIEGHTDNQGPATDNLQLSKDRAAACADFFKAGGISASRLDSDGYRETRPIASNYTSEGRANNRRVEFELSR